jgi:hypothetical protein
LRMAEALTEVQESIQRDLDAKKATVFRVKRRGPV